MTRLLCTILLAIGAAAATLPAQSSRFPVSELRPGMVAVGRTVFQGDTLEPFSAHIIGVLHNVIGPARDLILARLEGGPLATTGVIAGMSGSPVYIDGRLVGAVSYSLGQFSKEPIAGITPIQEMVDAATLPPPRRAAARIEPGLPLTPDGLRDVLRQAFTGLRPFATSPADVQVLGQGIDPGMGTLLRPIATPMSLGGFDTAVVEPLSALLRDHGFVPVMAGGAQVEPARSSPRPALLRPGDAVGVTLVSGDLSLGATGTVTHVEGERVYAFGHPFYGLGPIQFPMTQAYVHAVLPSLAGSMKIASTGAVVGTVYQDRATAIAGTLGPGPDLIPLTLALTSERGIQRTFTMGMVSDQLFTPLLAYMTILNTLTGYERQNGVGTFALKGRAQVKGHQPVTFEDVFAGDQPSGGAAAAVVGPLALLMRNAFEDVELEGMHLEIQASERPRSATLERVWVDQTRIRPGMTVDVKALLRTYRGEEVVSSVPIQVPANARGSVSIMVADGPRLAQFEFRELQVQPLQARGVAQMIQVLNESRKHNRLYVRLVTRDGGAVVRGESLAALPASVLSVIEADRSGGNVRPLQSALVGEWEIPADYAVSGARTLTLSLED